VGRIVSERLEGVAVCFDGTELDRDMVFPKKGRWATPLREYRWHVGCPRYVVQKFIQSVGIQRPGGTNVINKLSILFVVAILAVGGSACATTDAENANTNANASPVVASNTTRPGSDNSEITTSTDANGVRTETRVFHNNPRVSRVVVTTSRDGQRTTTVYGPTGEPKDLKDKTVDALEGAGSAIADAAGFVADKSEDVAGKVTEGAKTAAEKTVEGAKTAAEKTKEGAGTVADKTKEGAKTAAEKTKEGAKKAGSAIKKAVTP